MRDHRLELEFERLANSPARQQTFGSVSADRFSPQMPPEELAWLDEAQRLTVQDQVRTGKQPFALFVARSHLLYFQHVAAGNRSAAGERHGYTLRAIKLAADSPLAAPRTRPSRPYGWALFVVLTLAALAGLVVHGAVLHEQLSELKWRLCSVESSIDRHGNGLSLSDPAWSSGATPPTQSHAPAQIKPAGPSVGRLIDSGGKPVCPLEEFYPQTQEVK
ncbi:MAG TPA: hypothetical protein VHC22_24090 [Pirellulales bacterium]|nr:hypothetical protein [Pirellulales bacterium]